MRNTPIVSITGYSGAGKDTLLELIEQKYNVVKLTNSLSLKMALSLITDTPMSVQNSGGMARKKPLANIYGRSIREGQQILGTDCCRNHFDDNIWKDSSVRRFKTLSSSSNALAALTSVEENLARLLDLRSDIINAVNGGSVWSSETVAPVRYKGLSPEEIVMDLVSEYRTLASVQRVRKDVKKVLFVKTDDRYPNEIISSRQLGGILLFIHRTTINQFQHDSEKHIGFASEQAHGVIHNNSAPENMLPQFERIVNKRLDLVEFLK